jgi:hypothetical protein
MKFGLNDNTVKRIAAVAHHTNGGTMANNISNIYTTLTHPDTINQVANAHTTDAMQHRFSTKDEENTFKRHLAHSASVNRGTIDLVPSDQSNVMNKSQ